MSSKKAKIQTMALFQQIARKNVKNNLKNYMIYFLTMTLGVALFYTFNSTNAQFAMMNMRDEGSYLTFASATLLGVSLFICVIMGFLVSYANRFLMRKRKKELGIYISLGIDQKTISKLIQKETLLIGGISLAAGLAVGIFLSQGLALISMQFLAVQNASYHFVFSPGAALGAICFFGLLFFVMYRVNNRTLKKYKLIDLLYADKKNENYREKSSVQNLLIAIFGGALIIGGYLMILGTDSLSPKWAGAGIVCIFIGTFFFIWAVSGVLLLVCKRRKKKYYRGINLFSVAQIASKFKTTNVSLSIICILLFLAISSMTIGLGMGKSFSQDLDTLTAYDATVRKIQEEGMSGRQFAKLQLEQDLEEKGLKISQIGAAGQISIYAFPDTKIQGKQVYTVSLSDYNKARIMQGLKPVQLSSNSYLLSVTDRDMIAELKEFLSQTDGELQVNGEKLKPETKNLLNMGYAVSNVNTGDGTAIVADGLLKGKTPQIKYLNINYTKDVEHANNVLADGLRNLQDKSYSLAEKSMVIVELTSSNLMMSYLAIYLGISFMICACVVLALQQMGEAEDNRKRYRALKQLGVRSTAIRKSIFQQIGVYFGLPLILALIHVVVLTVGFYMMLPPMGIPAIIYNTAFAAIVTGAVYGSYFFLTYLSGKSAAEEDVSQ
ncbi:ABC transporter permease [Anaerovorax odorimutans]|nr:ABC transporter permease [Anaerovorax odorimutans]